MCPQKGAHLEPAESGQHQVENRDVKIPLLSCNAQRLFTSRSLRDLEACPLKVDTQQITDRLLIFQYQHFHEQLSFLLPGLLGCAGQLNDFIQCQLQLIIILQIGPLQLAGGIRCGHYGNE